MYECLNLFSTPTRAWFEHAFREPTAVQQQAWPVISSGGNVLVIAPTGSGKTLTAFLSAIDRLMTHGGVHEGIGDDARHIADETVQRAAHDTLNSAVQDLAQNVARIAVNGAQPSGTVQPKDTAQTVENHAASAGRARRGKRHAKHGVRVLYISPLKALAVDVARNLNAPLVGIAAECRSEGVTPPDIRVAIRSGDTTPKERRSIATHPPDILVTTPESLFLLLTSKVRSILSTVETVILDEVHALAGSKRGAHLALSLERLDLLTPAPAQRVGLSATVRPASEAARFIGGGRDVAIIEPKERPVMDLRVVEPLADMRDIHASKAAASAGSGAHGRISGVSPAMQRLAERSEIVAKKSARGSSPQFGQLPSGTDKDFSGSIWPAIERDVLDEILRHHTTLVFVNSRGLAERLTAKLNDLYAESLQGADSQTQSSSRHDYGSAAHYDSVVGSSTNLVESHGSDTTIAMAHHGSVSKDRRKRIEEDLKHGRLRCVVATSSLELGIDMGSVDLVMQIAPPLSVSSGLQRVGRADHRVGGVSHALFYPLTREQLIGSAACIESMVKGDIEPLSVIRSPLDILAQQTVAAAAMNDLRPDDWYVTVRRAAPFATLERDMFDAVLGMLTGSYDSEDFSAFRPPLQWNHENNVISARPGAQRLAVTSGGTIPDRGMYTVVLPEAQAGPGPRRVGELDEEMVYESRVGDVITLGTSTWQIKEITNDRVIVNPAPGRTARLPFWHGEGNGRDVGFGMSKGRFIREMTQGLISAHDGENARFNEPITRRLHDDGLDNNACANLAGLLSEQVAATDVVANDQQLVVERCEDEEGDWRVILHSPFGRRVHEPWSMVVANRLKARYGFDGQCYAADDGIVVRIPQTSADIPADQIFLFDPDELQRDVENQVGESVLFSARFRECAARSLYLPRTKPGKRVPLWQQRLRSAQLLQAARTQRNFPLILETARECLQDVYDLPALRSIMTALDSGDMLLHDVRTETPSSLAGNLLFGFVGSVMYQYDVPQAERAASLLSMDPEVLERLIGGNRIAEVLDEQTTHDVEEELAQTHFWNELASDDVTGRVTRYAKTHGPFTADEAIAVLGFDAVSVVRELDALVARGDLLSGHFTGEGAIVAGVAQYLHRDVFRRIRNRSLAKARAAIKLVSSAAYQSYLIRRQGIMSVGAAAGESVAETGRADSIVAGRSNDCRIGSEASGVGSNGEESDAARTGIVHDAGNGGASTGTASTAPVFEGADGLLRVLEQLEGLSLPASLWESAIFPARIRDYQPSMLDELLSSGDIVWVGSGSPAHGEAGQITWYLADSPLLAAVAPGRDTAMKSSSKNLTNHATALRATASDAALHATPHAALHSATASTYSDDIVQKDDRIEAASLTAPRITPGTDNSTNPPASRVTPDDAIMQVLESGGAYPVHRLTALCTETAEQTMANSNATSLTVNESTGELSVPWTEIEFQEALWNLVWSGAVTNSSFAPVRALSAPRSARRAVPRRRGWNSRARVRVTVPPALSGLWSLVPQDFENQSYGSETRGHQNHESSERIAVARVEALLERYGVIAQPVIDRESLPGGFAGIYPVLKAMEEAGKLVRGMFVTGLSGVQFAERQTVDALRAQQSELDTQRDNESQAVQHHAESTQFQSGPRQPQPPQPFENQHSKSALQAVALDALDPANLAGGAVPWPQTLSESGRKPSRREGSIVVMVQGEAVLYMSQRHLLVFARNGQNDDRKIGQELSQECDDRKRDDQNYDGQKCGERIPSIQEHKKNDQEHSIQEPNDAILIAALHQLIPALQRSHRGSIVIADVNGEPLTSTNHYARLLRAIGFVPAPQGMTLYR
ncbi:MAG: DEAD/DEAH box helicase [Bifidobacterium subtile]|jgi:ATP-dependent Lhr-like helicase|nr:DEAD/DEAH box helicase [Bifidobacterium subtile]MCI1258289.1 DEAD/DEAH box helicase [Bifidobacterium subtile]